MFMYEEGIFPILGISRYSTVRYSTLINAIVRTGSIDSNDLSRPRGWPWPLALHSLGHVQYTVYILDVTVRGALEAGVGFQ